MATGNHLLIAEEAVARARCHWKTKTLLSISGAVLFTGSYALLQAYPQFPITQAKAIWIDQCIPFVPGTVYLYESLWPLAFIALFLIRSNEDLFRYCRNISLVCLAGFACFLLFPTSAPRPVAHEINALYAALIQVDKDLNAFPSLHAALAVYCGANLIFIIRANGWNRSLQWAIWTWVFLILVSTLLTKQHVFIDILAGVLLGGVGCLVKRPIRTPSI